MIGRSPSRLKCGVATHLFSTWPILESDEIIHGLKANGLWGSKNCSCFCSFLDGEDEAHVLYGVVMFLSSIAPMFVCPV